MHISEPYILSVRRLAVLLVILTDFVEIVFVQLAHETGEIAVFEMLGQDGLGELLALDLLSRVSQSRCDRTAPRGAFTSRTTKLSPSSPQRTMEA